MRSCFIASAFLLLLAFPGWPAITQAPRPALPAAGKTVAQTLAQMGIAATFYKGLKAARLDSLLNGSSKNQYTVFVPSNEAFKRLAEHGLGLASTTGRGLDQHQQELLLRFHVIPGRYPTEALKSGQALRSLNPAFAVKVSAQGPRVFVSGTNTAPVELLNAYILCSNGVIHLIDDVLLPFARQVAPPRPAAPRPAGQ
ncbi:fasciclin domain-containing protein [Hymenobacter sp. DH14]|uniref:Fasciclin domain-containing protein n=1 Tax=Hymenobacter cyanobacteriorum TaxID=2926463 RepID=A0A9X1VF20_9BACT|nr:fasciclin domain-containing protein [Hymenobacter cyanobacteriorum]MCI1187408.1 fasciclin domain-containing protein [Hymenobacter cyanobacteriorum]